MPKFTFSVMMVAGLTVLSSAALACSSGIPTYIGDRSANPEQETYGYVLTVKTQRLVGFTGPARKLGAITGDAEKDTIAYRPLIGSSKELLLLMLNEPK